jgi:hypothetical protein
MSKIQLITKNLIRLFTMKKYHLLLIFLTIAACKSRPPHIEINADKLRDSLLHKYSFVRNQYNPATTGLLIGNNEMGGLVSSLGMGFDKIWAADLWLDSSKRIPVIGPQIFPVWLETPDRYRTMLKYNQTLDLKNGIVKTKIEMGQEGGYESEIFFSMNTKDLLLIKIKDLKKALGKHWWRIHFPVPGSEYLSRFPDYPMMNNGQMFELNKIDSTLFTGTSTKSTFIKAAWALKSNTSIFRGSEGEAKWVYYFTSNFGDEIEIRFSLNTQFDGKDMLNKSINTVTSSQNYAEILQSHKATWDKLWDNTSVISIPDTNYESLFYRSIFWMFSTSGNEKFLPGECNFATPCWHMQPFTYGHAGWSIYAFNAIGKPELAKNNLRLFYKPDRLQKNALLLIPKLQTNPAAWCFGHQIGIDGGNLGTHYEQCHIEAFGAGFFHNMNDLYPDKNFERDTVYPILRGMAEFWRSMVIWDENLKSYKTPILRSLCEELFKEGLLDATLSAKWNLMMASRYAEKLNKDTALRIEWGKIADKLYVAQNEKHYLEFIGDDVTREGKGYQGVRGDVYLGWPICEIIPFLDIQKVNATLDNNLIRKKYMYEKTSYDGSWLALTFAHYGKRNEILKPLSHTLKGMDDSKTWLGEVEGGFNPYFGTGYDAYILAITSMMVQSNNGEIKSFPCIPDKWGNVSFYNVPASGGIRVSGEWKDGKAIWAKYSKGNQKVQFNNPVQVVNCSNLFK